eukprot:gene7771-biopygen6073
MSVEGEMSAAACGRSRCDRTRNEESVVFTPSLVDVGQLCRRTEQRTHSGNTTWQHNHDSNDDSNRSVAAN